MRAFLSPKDPAPDYCEALQSYIPLKSLADHLRCHVATPYRWTSRGCRGVKLRYSQIGATRCTTREWLDEFFGRLTEASTNQGDPRDSAQSAVTPRTAARSESAAERAGRELTRRGI